MASGNLTTVTSTQYSKVVEKRFETTAKSSNNVLSAFNSVIVHGADAYVYSLGDSVEMLKMTDPDVDITNTNRKFENVKVLMEPYYLSIPTPFNFDDMVAADILGSNQAAVANAMFRRAVKCGVEALEASTNAPIAGALTDDLIIDAACDLIGIGGDEDDRHGIISTSTLKVILKSTKATSIDYVDVKALQKAKIGEWAGITWHVLKDSFFTDPKKAFIFNKSAVGIATGIDKIMNEYSTQRLGRVIQGILNVGAKIIQPEGVVVLKGSA